MLECGWPGLFRHHILPSIPVNKVTKNFSETFGRPTKELFSMLGALILQQTFDFTDEETVQQYAFNIHWHYGLNITEESDSAEYIFSLKNLCNSRNIVASNNLEDDIFNAGTQKLAQFLEVNIDKHLKRSHQSQFDTIDEKVSDK